MRYASISIGIVEYRARYYHESNMRLRFAASDAIAFHRYLEQATSPEDSRHILITDSEASSDSVSAAFAQLAHGGQVEVFILYLSGHGERGNDNGGWFCLADAEPGTCSLGGEQLDTLLESINAAQVLLVVDCCYAEALFRHSRYFAHLGTSRTRLLIASARAYQQAWEDETLNRSIFSEVLLRGCSSELHLQDTLGMIDVERALFPYLREQVVLLTAANKSGLVQEPVTGGLAALPLLLHSVSSKAFGRQLSVSETLRARLKQIIIGTTSTALIVLALVHIMTYHLITDSAGNIQVRTGLVFTASLLPPSLVSQIDTGYSVAQLDPRKTAFLSTLSHGEVRGIGSHLDDLGLKAWSSGLAPFLKSPVAASYSIMVRGEPAKFDPNWSGPPLSEVQFLLSKHPGMAPEQVGQVYSSDLLDPPTCMANPTGKIDFTSLNPSAKVASEEALWWALRAGSAANLQLETFDKLIARTAYRSLHAKDTASIRYETDFLALALLILGSQATIQTLTEMRQHATTLLSTYCRLHGALALGLISPDAQSGSAEQAEATLTSELSQYDRSTQGDLETAQQEVAVDALMLFATRRPLSVATLDVITQLVRNDAGEIGSGTFPQRILLALAERQALPSRLHDYLDKRLRRLPAASDGFEKLGIVRVLARNVRFLPAEKRQELKHFLSEMRRTDKTLSEYHEALGFAGPAGTDLDARIGLLSARLSPATLFPVPTATYRGDTFISSNGDAAATALGRIAQHTKLDESIRERLDRLALARTNLAGRAALIAGLAYQRYGNEAAIADAIHDHLAAASADGRQRALEVEIACTALIGRSLQVRRHIAAQLAGQWNQESAPELRYALASTIGRMRFPAIGQLNLCTPLSEVEPD